MITKSPALCGGTGAPEEKKEKGPSPALAVESTAGGGPRGVCRNGNGMSCQPSAFMDRESIAALAQSFRLNRRRAKQEVGSEDPRHCPEWARPTPLTPTPLTHLEPRLEACPGIQATIDRDELVVDYSCQGSYPTFPRRPRRLRQRWSWTLGSSSRPRPVTKHRRTGLTWGPLENGWSSISFEVVQPLQFDG